jgi:RNA polymerase sigma-70 factor (ECF subfamily)
MAIEESSVQSTVQNARQGDIDSVGRLYDHFSQKIYRFFVFRVKTVEEAEDLTQTVFLKMIRSLPRYRQKAGATFSAWLFQIARFTLIDHYRTNREIVSLDMVENLANPQLQSAPVLVSLDRRAKQVQQLVKQLPEAQQTVLHLSFVEEMSPREIARAMRVSVISVRVWKHRALKRLNQMLNIL